MTMSTRQLGANGPMVSAIGVGAMSFADMYGPTDEANSHAILRAALDEGITHIDTANVYGMGKSENAIGSFLKANPSARDTFVIATKAAITSTPDGKRAFDNSPEHMESELDASLKRLGVEAVDLFYVHRRDQRFPIEEVAGTMARLVEKGKTRAIGFSEIAPTSLRLAHAVHPVAAVQSEYSLSVRAPELGLVQTCAELGVALVAFSPVGRSLLTDHPLSFEASQASPFLKENPRFVVPNYARNMAASAPLRDLGKAMGEPAAALAVAWLLAQGDHILPIPGTRSTQHFSELVRAAHLNLSPDDLKAIEEALPVGWAHGDRYSVNQWFGPENYC
jgi:aryl-alcohol dehydrogenase-like predicted oxidoreductase